MGPLKYRYSVHPCLTWAIINCNYCQVITVLKSWIDNTFEKELDKSFMIIQNGIIISHITDRLNTSFVKQTR